MDTNFTAATLDEVFGFPKYPPKITHNHGAKNPIPTLFLSETNYTPEIADQEDSELTASIRELRGGRLYTSSTDGVFEAEGIKNFDGFELPQALLQGIYSEMGFDRPSEIQAQTLPLITRHPYASLVAQAHNGSGKTCCFALCILSRLDYSLKSPQALVVVPTRELAVQNAQVIEKMGRFTQVTILATSATDDVHQRGTLIKEMVIVGTMGSLQTWRKKGWLPFRHLKVVVFDEADLMIEERGFGDHCLLMMMQVEKENAHPQLLLFSATYSARIRDLTEKLFAYFPRKDVYKTYVPDSEISLDTIAQANICCRGYHDKIRCITENILPYSSENGNTIIFVRYRSTARNLHEILRNADWTVTSISGEMESAARDRVVREFKTSITRILISTDVLARGFDVLDVKVVINFDIPIKHVTREPAYETYLHRVGRSGRFKRSGAAFNLIDTTRPDGEDDNLMKMISEHFDRSIPTLNVDNESAVQEFFKRAGLLQ